jgi:hypothetical protein
VDAIPSQSPKPALQVIPQAPAAQRGAPLTALQTAPQAPQRRGSVRRFTSQPLAGSPSQSAKPVRHAATPQRPAEHEGTAFAGAQTIPQAPQWATVELVRVSHPVDTTPSQSPKPASQVMEHAPAAHRGAPLTALHARPHAPQCRTSAAVLASQPLDAAPSQSAKPALQLATTHPPARHAAVAFGSMHPAPQAPQWAAVTWRSVSQPFEATPSQSPRVGAAHMVRTHAPASQRAPAPGKLHRPPHLPQCRALLRVSTSQPLAGSPSQSAKPALHAATAQRPAAQAPRALAGAHARPQAPQCAALARVSASQPFMASPSQSAKPSLQALTHAPAAQDTAALARGAHGLPQPPQCAVAVRVSASHPSEASALQSPKPAWHRAPQRPAAQVAVALARAGHRAEHSPQWSTESRRSVSHPLDPAASQLP